MNELEAYKVFKLIYILRNMVIYHNRLYYENDDPELSDADYDRLYYKLVELERKHPWAVKEEDVTQRVGGVAQDKFKKIKHLVPMLSLDKVHTFEQFLSWDRSMKKLLETNK